MSDLFSALSSFVTELRRRRVFRVAAVYAVVAWAVIQGAGTILPMLEAPLWVGKVVLVLVSVGFPAAIALAWAFDVTPSGIVRTSAPDSLGPQTPSERHEPSAAADVAPGSLPQSSADQPAGLGKGRVRNRRLRARAALIPALVLIAAAAGAYARFFRPGPDAITSIAVLPLTNLSGDPANEYFSDGLADEILNQLGNVPGLRVAARTSSFFFKGKNLPVKDIARRLEVEAVVEGSVQRTGGRIHLTAQLISGRTGYHLWSDSYDRDANDAFAVEEEVAKAIASALRVKLGPPIQARVHVPDPAAHDAYMRGRFLLNRGSKADMERAIQLFDEAIVKDSGYAVPYAAAATAWQQLADAYVAPLEAYPKAESLARRALKLDSSNADARAVLGFSAMVLRWDWTAAKREIERAIHLDPDNAQAREDYADYLRFRGDDRAALAQYREASRLDPYNAYFAHQLGVAWGWSGEEDSARAAFARAEEITPGYVYLGAYGAGFLRAKHKYAEALALDQQALRARGVPTSGLVTDLVRLGRRAEAEAALREMIHQSTKRYVAPEDVAGAAFTLGHRDIGFDWLERGVDVRSAFALNDGIGCRGLPPDLRSEPRLRRLLERMGLDAVCWPPAGDGPP